MPISQPSYPIETQDLVTHVGAYTDAQDAAALLTTITTQTANYTLALTDAGTLVRMDSASSRVFTVPPNSSVAYPVGTSIELLRYGAGAVTITPGAGVTLPNAIQPAGTASRTITGQMLSVSLLKMGTDEWLLSGSLA